MYRSLKSVVHKLLSMREVNLEPWDFEAPYLAVLE